MNNILIGILSPALEDEDEEEYTSQEHFSIMQTILLKKVKDHVVNDEPDDSEFKQRGIPVYKLYIPEIDKSILYVINGPNYN